ncbi:MAG TPA: hypothetical protein VK484_01220 [Ferruginibacter sp.]|nr:hypothetical protein [Ferruginibacter sp.]
MKKILLITILFFITEFNQGFAENKITPNTSKKFAANFVGYFTTGGVEYSVYVYFPTTPIVKITWQDVNPPYYTLTSPNILSGSYTNQNPSTSVTFVGPNGNNVSYVGNLYNY